MVLLSCADLIAALAFLARDSRSPAPLTTPAAAPPQAVIHVISMLKNEKCGATRVNDSDAHS